MTVSARCSPLAFFSHDRVVFREFPFEFAGGDPGGGSGGSSSIAVELTRGNFTVAWLSYGNKSVATGDFPPSGYGYPSQPSQAALASALNWWPQGFHHYGQVSWSRNFGVVVSSVLGLLPSGEVVPHNFCYPFIPNKPRRWMFLAYSSQTTDGRNPYGANANAWWQHFGYDLKRRKDLVAVENAVGSGFLSVYEISGTIPATRGAKVWQGTNGDRALRHSFWTTGGQQHVQIPWLGVWWVNQYTQGSLSSSDQVWGFAPTSSPATSMSATPEGFAVTVPPDVHTRAGGGNLHFVVDQMGKRVFAYQADTNIAPTVVSGVNKYPLLIWDVNPTTFVWTPVTLGSTLLVAIGGKTNVAPMAYFGGHKFVYFDVRNAVSASWGDNLSIPGNPIPAQTKKTGGLYVREIFIPKANPPRTITWTQHTWSGALGSQYGPQKHVEMTFNTADGKIYCFGGDHAGLGDSTLDSGSYNNQILSFTPESGADLKLEQIACPATRSINHPIRVDENGFQYRPTSAEFFMMMGYGAGNWKNQCGWIDRAEWEAAGGGNLGKVWKWTKAGGWVNAGLMVPKVGFAGRVWTQGEEHCRRWYFDSGVDKLIAASFGPGADLSFQTTGVQILDCVPNRSGQYEFSKYRADRCFNGQGGDTAKLPDGRPITDSVVGATMMWRSDRAAVDPTTGHVYVYQPATGDVFRIYTRSDFFTYEGRPAARVDWVCRAIPSGTRSYNLAHFIWAKRALWMFFQSGTGRLRVFSWANAEEAPIEHPTPLGAVGTAVAKYVVGADERICVVGNQTVSSWSPLVQAKLLHYYTISLR